jgi:thiamine pyrophosphokinase
MSSHHIVRDEQEPALVIHRFDSFPAEQLGQLLEWSPVVICCGPALDQILEQGVKIDLAIVPFEHTDKYKEALRGQEPVKIISLSQPNYLLTSLQLLQKEGHKAVNIITTAELKDEVIESIIEYVQFFDIVIFDESHRHLFINRTEFSKWLMAGSPISLTPLGEPGNIRTEGFSADINQSFDDTIELMQESEGQVKIFSETFPFLVTEKA